MKVEKKRPTWGELEIAGMAEQVQRGQVVTTDLNDGSFVALMTELRRRGYAPVARKPAEKELKPFLVKVGQANAKHD